ncbi:hypothetical protein CWS43_09790 [Rahnella sp. AA]|uniref:hypothetical protein n=1 Tax=Rahnella sp. AA TaxID=2057180 RepID=UPI000C347558|nr:hypothetical protein [Rahnella sp. AA]PKE30963.1 hypothetical protein CWS43_09790 [Rahnella sp. AA]
MVSAQVTFCVVGHNKRRDMATRLADTLSAHLLIDEGDHGSNWNHRRAIEWAGGQACRVVVIEDDAIPVSGFIETVTDWLGRFPDDLISFYLGTGRPPQYQMAIAGKLINADKNRSDFVTLPRLIHGVCYSPPKQVIDKILSRWNYAKAADYAVGDAYGGAVIYPCYSLVDHLDESSVESHPDNVPRTERRKAWRLYQ